MRVLSMLLLTLSAWAEEPPPVDAAVEQSAALEPEGAAEPPALDADAEISTSEVNSVPEVPIKLINVKRRVAPRWPTSSKSAQVTYAHCQVKVWIDEEGKPYQVLPNVCDQDFANAVIVAVKQWRFKPWLVDDQASKAAFLLDVNFKQK